MYNKQDVNNFVYNTSNHRKIAGRLGLTYLDFNGLRKLRDPPLAGWKYRPASYYGKRWRDRTNAGYVKHIEREREQEQDEAQARGAVITFKQKIRKTGWRRDGWRITQEDL